MQQNHGAVQRDARMHFTLKRSGRWLEPHVLAGFRHLLLLACSRTAFNIVLKDGHRKRKTWPQTVRSFGDPEGTVLLDSDGWAKFIDDNSLDEGDEFFLSGPARASQVPALFLDRVVRDADEFLSRPPMKQGIPKAPSTSVFPVGSRVEVEYEGDWFAGIVVAEGSSQTGLQWSVQVRWNVLCRCNAEWNV